MTVFDEKEHPHKRLNILTGEWVLVSPHRTKRPWQGKTETAPPGDRPAYDAACYLCPGNKRADGNDNPAYEGPYVFTNDYSALLADTPFSKKNDDELLVAESEQGICRVISFSPDHGVTLPLLSVAEITAVVALWREEYRLLSAKEWVRYIQVFENKGDIMGCSNPHPHGQIWASSSIPVEIEKETLRQKQYYRQHGRSLLSAYLEKEQQLQERIILENEHFIALVPYWAVWPYETMIISKRQVENILAFTAAEQQALAEIVKMLTTRYDNLFETSFPYSAGMHQAPVNSGNQQGWHWHMHFYPPLLRSATVKKFMVGYELLAGPQRDITAEYAAARLRELSNNHYRQNVSSM